MDKKKKEKVIGISGIILFLVTLILMKIVIFYKIIIGGSNLFTGFILFCLGIIGLFMARGYLTQLFNNK